MKQILSTVAALVGAMTLVQPHAARAQALDELVAAAQAEGQLTVVALPRNWCNYGELIQSFTETYGIKVNELDPDAGSTDALAMLRKPATGGKSLRPDVIDVNLATAERARTENLLEPYKVSTWDTIPSAAKDVEAYWYGGYFGLPSFIVNREKLLDDLPRDWAELLRPDYVRSVSLTGDPSQFPPAAHAVYAAGLGPGVEKDTAKAAQAGVDFFSVMQSRGNFLPVAGNAGTLADGKTPLLITWDYNSRRWADSFAGRPKVEVVIPQTGLVANLFAQAIAADARNPNAAKLWMEHLYSDRGQIMWLKGYCNPVRLSDLARSGKIPEPLLTSIQPVERYERVVFPSLSQILAYRDTVARQWNAAMKAAEN